MLRSIPDTGILSEYLKGHDSNVIRRAARYAQDYSVFTFTSVTVYEIVYGLELTDHTAVRGLFSGSQDQGRSEKERLGS